MRAVSKIKNSRYQVSLEDFGVVWSEYMKRTGIHESGPISLLALIWISSLTLCQQLFSISQFFEMNDLNVFLQWFESFNDGWLMIFYSRFSKHLAHEKISSFLNLFQQTKTHIALIFLVTPFPPKASSLSNPEDNEKLESFC